MRSGIRRTLSSLAVLAVVSGSVLVAGPAFAASSVTIDSPTAGSIDGDGTIRITGAVSGFDAAVYSFDGGESNDVPDLDVSSSFDFEAAVAGDGTHTLRIQTPDGDAAEVQFDVDTTDPVFSFASPGDGDSVAGDSEFWFSATVTDVTPVVWQLTDGADVLGSGTDGSADGAEIGFSVDTTGWLHGIHTLTLSGTDGTGRTAQVTHDLSVDAPQIQLDSPYNGQVFPSDSLPVNGSITDSDGIDQFWVEVSPEGSGPLSSVSIAGGSGRGVDPVVLSFSDASPKPQGSYVLRVLARDLTGVESEQTVLFKVDTENPELAFTTPAEGELLSPGSTFDFAGTVRDFSFVNWTLARGGEELATGGGGNSTDVTSIEQPGISTTGWEPGDHVLTLTGTDEAGHVTTITRTVTIAGPRIVISSPTDGAFITGNYFWLEGSITDPASDLERWYLEARLTSSNDPAFLIAGEGGIGEAMTSPRDLHTRIATWPWANGVYELHLWARDTAGAEADRTFEVLVVDASPGGASTIVTPAPGQTFDSTSVRVAGAIETDGDTPTYVLDGDEPVELDPPSTGSPTQTPFDVTLTGLSEGPHTVTVSGASEPVSVTFVVDTVDPVLHITAPVYGQRIVEGDLIDFAGTVIDDTLVDWTLVHRTSGGDETVLGSGSHSASDDPEIEVDDIDTAGWAGGSHSLILRGVDRAGHSVERSVEVAIGGPLITVSSPTRGAVISNGSLDLQFSIADDSSVANWGATIQAPDGSQPWHDGAGGVEEHLGALIEVSTVLDTSAWPDGTYSLIFGAVYDDDGNFTEVAPVEFTIDNLDPGTVITEPTEGQTLHSSSVNVVGSLGNVNRAPSYSVDGGSPVTLLMAVGAEPTTIPFSFWISGLSEGPHSVRVFADSESITRNFFVDLAPRITDVTLDQLHFRPGDIITFGATITDSSPVAYALTYNRHAVSYGPFGASGAVAPSIDTTGFDDGVYDFVLLASDDHFNQSEVHRTVYINAELGVPTLTSPSAGESNADPDLEFAWAGVDEADYYEFRLSPTDATEGDGSLTDGVTSFPGSGVTSLDGLGLAEGDYYWQVRAAEWLDPYTVDFGAWSDARKVTIDTTAPSVILDAPAADGTSATSDVTFSWHSPDADVDLYALRFSSSAAVDDDGGLTSATTVVTSDPSKVVTGLANGRYHWQVRALDLAGNVGAWTHARMLDVAKAAASVPPTSTSPGATGGDDESTDPAPTGTTQPTPDPEPTASDEPAATGDGDGDGADASGAGETDATAPSDDPGFPFLWIIVVIVALAGGGFLIRFLVVRRG